MIKYLFSRVSSPKLQKEEEKTKHLNHILLVVSSHADILGFICCFLFTTTPIFSKPISAEQDINKSILIIYTVYIYIYMCGYMYI